MSKNMSVMIHPFLCYLGIALSFTLSFILFIYGVLDVQKYFYAPVFLLIAFYTAHAMITDKQKYQKRSFKQAAGKAVGKYIFWGLVLLGIIGFYYNHPLYWSMTPNTRRFFVHFFYAFCVIGLPYFYLEEKYRYSRDNVQGDAYTKIVILVRCLLRKKVRLFGRRLAGRQTRRMVLSAILRIHYLPIMIEQVYYGTTTFTLWSQASNFQLNLLTFIFLTTILCWLIDSNNAGIGYFWQSSFTKTRFREVDPYPFHWIVVLICYMPIILFVSQFIPFPSPPEGTPLVFSHTGLNTVIEIAMLIVLVLYMLSGSALSFVSSMRLYSVAET
ncbi:hypothetical protein ACFL02_07480, partial [Planctomycetota bacterium]